MKYWFSIVKNQEDAREDASCWHWWDSFCCVLCDSVCNVLSCSCYPTPSKHSHSVQKVVDSCTLECHLICLYSSVFGFFFCIQFIVAPVQSDAEIWWEEYGPFDVTEQCVIGKSTPTCGFISFLNQFFALGTELFYLALSMDLHSSLNNPFNSYKTNIRKYKVGVILISILSGLILIFLGLFDTVFNLSINPCNYRR